MPTLAELLLALIADQTLPRDENWEVALRIMCLIRRVRTNESAPEREEPIVRILRGIKRGDCTTEAHTNLNLVVDRV